MEWKPLSECGQWRGLAEDEKWSWLQSVRDEHFKHANEGCVQAHRSGQTFVINGDHIEDAPSFFCVVGEAINGPGGYFGANMMAFDDCLCGGFGLDAPSTLVWRNSARSKVVLDSAALARNVMRDEARAGPVFDPRDSPLVYNREKPEYQELLRQAEAGTRTMFEEIVSMIEFRSTTVDLGFLMA